MAAPRCCTSFWRGRLWVTLQSISPRWESSRGGALIGPGGGDEHGHRGRGQDPETRECRLPLPSVDDDRPQGYQRRWQRGFMPGRLNALLHQTPQVRDPAHRILCEPGIGVIDDGAFLVSTDMQPVDGSLQWCAPVDHVVVVCLRDGAQGTAFVTCSAEQSGSLFAAHGDDPHVHTATGVALRKDVERGVVDVDEAVVEGNYDLQAVGRATIDVIRFVSHGEVDWEAPRVLDRLGGYERGGGVLPGNVAQLHGQDGSRGYLAIAAEGNRPGHGIGLHSPDRHHEHESGDENGE